MEVNTTDFFLVIDLEATCWQGEEAEKYRGQNEIIEIGLSIISPAGDVCWEGGWFVRPVFNLLLSSFCQELTSIRQDDVDKATVLPEVLCSLSAKVLEVTSRTPDKSIFVSWGNYDRRQFESDCARHDIKYPFGKHINLKEEFMRKHNLKRRCGVQKALSVLKLDFVGTPHRGADDAHNIARILIKDFL
jgi:inhibitor of KinA sporulation pathway (predicted exonuclease)